ncbi:hypothetical protein BDR26DRAFT_697263 [Obelidium mucronatum]|nr:hypothetical protein BDR26DRAFT_697263 [Obelidium mucronatum]
MTDESATRSPSPEFAFAPRAAAAANASVNANAFARYVAKPPLAALSPKAKADPAPKRVVSPMAPHSVSASASASAASESESGALLAAVCRALDKFQTQQELASAKLVGVVQELVKTTSQLHSIGTLKNNLESTLVEVKKNQETLHHDFLQFSTQYKQISQVSVASQTETRDHLEAFSRVVEPPDLIPLQLDAESQLSLHHHQQLNFPPSPLTLSSGVQVVSFSNEVSNARPPKTVSTKSNDNTRPAIPTTSNIPSSDSNGKTTTSITTATTATTVITTTATTATENDCEDDDFSSFFTKPLSQVPKSSSCIVKNPGKDKFGSTATTTTISMRGGIVASGEEIKEAPHNERNPSISSVIIIDDDDEDVVGDRDVEMEGDERAQSLARMLVKREMDLKSQKEKRAAAANRRRGAAGGTSRGGRGGGGGGGGGGNSKVLNGPKTRVQLKRQMKLDSGSETDDPKSIVGHQAIVSTRRQVAVAAAAAAIEASNKKKPKLIR